MSQKNSHVPFVTSTTTKPSLQYDVIIIGGGTAGLFCAYNAMQRGLKIALIEQNNKLGVKLRMAGGGMGNMTNRTLTHHSGHEHFISHDPKSTKLLNSLFRHFTCNDVLKLLHEFNIPFEERDYGQIFCLEPVSHFVDALHEASHNVDFYLGERPQNLYYSDDSHSQRSYHVHLSCTHLHAKNLVIATGSNAYPQIGASDFGLRLAKKWGLSLHEFEPALVPFIINDSALLGLEGISLPVRMHTIIGNKTYHDPCGIRPMLFTHKGISGPASLVMSCFWQKDAQLFIDFLPENLILLAINKPENSKKILKNIITQLLPERLAKNLVSEDLQSRKVAELSKKDRLRVVNAIHHYQCATISTDTMKKAEVAKGGIAINELSNSLESKRHPHCYFCGEVLDITGLLGGYNIHFALASAKKIASSF